MTVLPLRVALLAALIALVPAARPQGAVAEELALDAPVAAARGWLARVMEARFSHPAQTALAARLRDGVSGMGRGRAIIAGRRRIGDRVPVFLKDGSALFLTVAPDGRLIEGVTLPLPESRFYRLPAEWGRERHIPLHLPESWVDPGQAPELPVFPILSSRRGGVSECVGLPVDPATLSDFHILPDALTLPAKNIEESPAFVTDLRDLAGFARARVRNEPREAPFLSISASSAVVVDWWRAQTSGSDEVRFPKYLNRLSGRPEFGCDPWEVRARFEALRAADPARHPVFPDFLDPVLGVPAPMALEPFARIVARPEPVIFAEFPPLTGGSATREAFLPGCRGAVRLFTDHAATLPDLVACLKRHGPVLAGTAPRVEGALGRGTLFAAAVVGAGMRDGVPCALVRDVYGDHPHDRRDDAAGGPAYRLLPLAYLREGWFFPHELEVALELDWEKPALLVRVRVAGGGPVDPTELSAVFENERLPVPLVRAGPGLFEGELEKRVLAHDRPAFRARARRDFFAPPGGTGDGSVEARHEIR